MPFFRILLWLLFVGAAWLFRMSYIGWFGPWLLAVVVVVPPVMFLLSLPSMLRMKILLQTNARVVKGTEAALKIAFQCRGLLPVHSVTIHLEIRNRYTGEAHQQSFIFRNVVTSESEMPLPTEQCGMLSCRILRYEAGDALGLFSIRRRCDAAAFCCVLPDAKKCSNPLDLEETTQNSSRLLPKYGGGFAEEHDLRVYRPGDPPNSIHWKLSSKTEDLIVREALVPEARTVYVVLALCGENDSGLSVLRWLSAELLQREEPHVIVADSLYPVGSEDECDAALANLLARPMGELCHFDETSARRIYTIKGSEVLT